MLMIGLGRQTAEKNNSTAAIRYTTLLNSGATGGEFDIIHRLMKTTLSTCRAGDIKNQYHVYDERDMDNNVL